MLTHENKARVNIKLLAVAGGYESAETTGAGKSFFLTLFTIYLHFEQELIQSSLPIHYLLKDRNKGSIWHDKIVRQNLSRSLGIYANCSNK
jgi:hypothetical protein